MEVTMDVDRTLNLTQNGAPVPANVEEDERMEAGTSQQQKFPSSSQVSTETSHSEGEEMEVDDQQRTDYMKTVEAIRRKLYLRYDLIEQKALLHAIVEKAEFRKKHGLTLERIAEDMCTLQIWSNGLEQWNERSIQESFKSWLPDDSECHRDGGSLKRKWKQWVTSPKWPDLLHEFSDISDEDRQLLTDLGICFVAVVEAKRQQAQMNQMIRNGAVANAMDQGDQSSADGGIFENDDWDPMSDQAWLNSILSTSLGDEEEMRMDEAGQNGEQN